MQFNWEQTDFFSNTCNINTNENVQKWYHSMMQLQSGINCATNSNAENINFGNNSFKVLAMTSEIPLSSLYTSKKQWCTYPGNKIRRPNVQTLEVFVLEWSASFSEMTMSASLDCWPGPWRNQSLQWSIPELANCRPTLEECEDNRHFQSNTR